MVPSSLFILASSVCKSLQCLISALTRRDEGGHLFKLTCSVVLWRERDTANKCHWRVWARSEWMDTWGFPQPKAACTSQVQAAQLPKCSKRAQSHVGRAPPWGSWSQAVTLLADRNRPGSQEDVCEETNRMVPVRLSHPTLSALLPHAL